MTDTNSLWYKYAQQILQIAAPTFDPKHQQFSTASSTLSVDLGNADPAIVNAYIYHIGNTIPAPSPSYSPGSSLLTSFRAFLDAIDLKGDPNPNLDSQINIAAASLTAAQNNFIAVQQAAVQAWTNYKAINPNISFADYVTNQYKTYGQARSALSGAESKYAGLMTQKYGQGYEIIADARDRVSADGGASDIAGPNSLNMPIKTGAVTAAGAVAALPGQTPQGPANALISSFAPSFSLDGFTSVFQQWQASSASSTKPAVSIKVDGSASASSWENMGWDVQASGGISYGFFDIWARTDTGSDSQSAFSMSDNFSLQIDFVGLQSFSVSPGEWFDLGLLQTYKKQMLPGSPAFFSAGGSLARYPFEAVIGFNPTITLGMSHSDYASMSSQFHSDSTGGLSFGPFVLGDVHASSYANKSAVAFDDSSATIRIAPPSSTVPILLGVISSRLDV